MKKKMIFLFFILGTCLGQIHAQLDEFKIYDNGLMYDESTMSQLHIIVDSLNLKYKTCDLTKEFKGMEQGRAIYFYLEGEGVKEAAKDLEKGMSIDRLSSKYPDSEILEDRLVVVESYGMGEGKTRLTYQEVSLSGRYGEEISFDLEEGESGDLVNQDTWVVKYTPDSKHYKEYVEGFYFKKGTGYPNISPKYSAMIQYVDCMVDTTTLIMKEDAESGDVNLPVNYQNLSVDEKKSLLDTMRNTIVRGFCSQDSRPRMHARNIAIVAAETATWEVFLRAHLNVMNDYFPRMSDGSYAWGKRKTYLRELEELGINTPDLILGSILRAEDVSEKHYFSSIRRIGRAMADAKDTDVYKKKLLEMMGDDGLDDYNRVLMFYLAAGFVSHLDEDVSEEKRQAFLKECIPILPGYLSAQALEGLRE